LLFILQPAEWEQSRQHLWAEL